MSKCLWTILFLATFFSIETKADYVFEIKELKPILCPSGRTADIFSLYALNSAPDASMVNRLIPQVDIPVMAKAELGMRLEVCFNSNQDAELKRLVFRTMNVSPFDVYTAGEDYFYKVVGLQDALFGDPSKLEIVARFKSDKRSVQVKGYSDQSLNFVIAVDGIIKDVNKPENWQLTSLYYLLGELKFGNPLGDLICQAGQWDSHSIVQLGTSTMEIDFCSFLGGGETTGYKIYRLTVQDTNEKLAAEYRGKKLVIEKNELDQYLKYKWNHHNACDSFVLKIPKWSTTYSASSSPMAGCGQTLPGAPERNYQEPDEYQKKALYRIEYSGEKSEIKLLNRGHFMTNL